MPKILINEVNNTSAGTPGRYGNYAVLIAGYQKTSYTDAELQEGGLAEVQAKYRAELCDANGVYEFDSANDFEKVIGLAEVEQKDSTGKITEYHYGNRMAYHLLKLGYHVIYKVIDQIRDMATADFWDVFKDKASYDFRFVSHGLLETCYDAAEHTKLNNRLIAINEALDRLDAIESRVAGRGISKDKDGLEAYLSACDKEYEAEIESGYTGFVNNSGLPYSTYAIALGLNNTGDRIGRQNEDAGLRYDDYQIQSRISEHDDNHITITVFNKINENIAMLANYRAEDADNREALPGRGDCIALIELDEDKYYENGLPITRPEEWIVEGINDMAGSIADAGKYCAMTVPSIYYRVDGEAVKFPGAFHYLACFMNSLRSGFAEWYAAAGYTRGVSSYVVDHTSIKLGEIAINTLEPRNLVDSEDAVQPKFACNVIANFRGSYYLWGNRTAAAVNSVNATNGDLTADHFLNIRQLCTTIKKQLYVACRRFTFDPNSDTLWFNFVNAITPTLEAMKADQGIRDYKVVKVFTDKKATLKAKIRIIPIEAVEDFDITVSLEDSFGEVSVAAEG